MCVCEAREPQITDLQWKQVHKRISATRRGLIGPISDTTELLLHPSLPPTRYLPAGQHPAKTLHNTEIRVYMDPSEDTQNQNRRGVQMCQEEESSISSKRSDVTAASGGERRRHREVLLL